MKIGYACINNSFDCRPSRTFRLDSYSEEYLVEKVAGNLDCLEKILRWNEQQDLLFFRITSDLVPFASHEVNQFGWQEHFADRFRELGKIIAEHDMRISMHPGQYTVLNSLDDEVVERAKAELTYHADVLELLGLDNTAKIQIHVGGVYGDKPAALARFIENYRELPERVQARLVVENDDTSYSLADTLKLHEEIGVPIIFDNLHHECLSGGEPFAEALKSAAATWGKDDGRPMVDYSSQAPGEKVGKHTTHIDEDHFREFLKQIPADLEPDIMLEIKDKEVSALSALTVFREQG